MTNDPVIETTIKQLDNAIIVKTRHYFVVDDFRYPYEEGEYFGYSLCCNNNSLPRTLQIRASGEPSEQIRLSFFNDVKTNYSDSRTIDLFPRKEPYSLEIVLAPLSPEDTESYWIRNEVSEKARELVRGCNNLEDKISKILRFVSSIPLLNHEKPSWKGLFDTMYPIDVLTDNGAYDCKDYTELMFELCRLVGIPARKINGVYDRGENHDEVKELPEGLIGGRYAGHAWLAFHDGFKWRQIDPTNDVSIQDFDGKKNYKDISVLRTATTNTSCEFSLKE